MYPLGLLIEPVTNRDVKVTDLPIVDNETCGWLVEGRLVVEDSLLQVMDLILILFGGNCGGIS